MLSAASKQEEAKAAGGTGGGRVGGQEQEEAAPASALPSPEIAYGFGSSSFGDALADEADEDRAAGC